MNHLNNLLIEGTLVVDPEVVAIAKDSNNKLVRFSVASNRVYVDKANNKQKETLFLTVIAWGSLADMCLKHLKKGTRGRFVGRLKMSKWETNSGERRSSYELVAQHIEFMRQDLDKKQKMANSTIVIEEKEGESDELSESSVVYTI